MTETSLPAGLERRREDIELITGHSHYVDDLRSPAGRPPALHMVVVRSPYAHAEIKDIRLDAARAVSGVFAVFTSRELVDVEYEPLPAVTDPEATLAPGAPLLYDEFGSNLAYLVPSGGGDIAAAFAQADHTVRLRLVNQRLAPNSMEPRACMFDFDAGTGQLAAWVSSQSVFRARDALSAFLGIERGHIHVHNAQVGGGFGTKTTFVGEEIIAAAMAVRYGRPVKWIESRGENLQAQTHGRGQINYVEAAFQNDGRLLGLKVRSIADLGAFLL